MLRENIPVGVIFIRRKEVRPFTDKQIALLKSFADQAVIAIENVRLFQQLTQKTSELESANSELREALEQQTATGEVLGVIASSPTELQPVLDTVITNAVKLIRADFGHIRRYDGEFLQSVAWFNMGTDEMVALQERSLRPNRETGAGRAFLERKPIHIPDVQRDPTLQPPPFRGRSSVAVPMLREGVPIGIIAVWREIAMPFTERQIELVKTFADQAVIAIENVRLFKEIQERNAELREALEHQTATSEVLGIISRSPTDVQPVLDAIVESAARVCGVDDVVLRLKMGDTWVLQAHFGSMPIRRTEMSTNEANVRWIREHGTLHIPDVRAQNDFPTVGVLSGWRTFLSAPLRQQGELVGSLNARRTEVRPFTPAQIKLLETFADQAVIAIENVRLFNELKESLEQQTATSEILGVIASSPTDVQPVLDVVAENAARVCGAMDAIIHRVDGNVLRRVAHYGPIPWLGRDETPPPVSRGYPSGRAVVDRRTIHIHDMAEESEAEFPEGLMFQRRAGHRTVLATPLLREGVAIGNIMIRREQVQPFTDRQIKLLETFAAQAVIAIENVRLFKELEERNAELREALEHQTATSEVLGIISRSPTDVQPVLDAIVESAARVCGIDDVILRLREVDVMTVRAHFGPVPPGRPEIGVDEAQYRWIREHGTLHVPDIPAQSDFPGLGTVGNRTYLAVPLRQQRQFIGVLAARHMDVHPFSPAQIKLFETFADQAVIAIENVRLFKELDERTNELTRSVNELKALGEVGQAVSSTLDLEIVLTRIASHAVQLTGAAGGAIYEYDEESKEFHLRGSYQIDREFVEALRASPIRLGGGPLGKAASSRAPVEVTNILDEREYAAVRFRTLLRRLGYRSLLAVPLLREQKIMGGITIFRRTTGSFPPQVVNLLQTFATQSVLAIQNARLFRE
ncbi:MAG: GAF domain-containing protein, partial [Deltaproteobacteria bacterium]|nr:GAF domain-containing protein [Deltaproteobacteria bacterium]